MIGRKRSRKRAHSESRIQFTYMHFPTSFPFLSPAFFIRFGFYIRFLLAVSTRRPPPSALSLPPSASTRPLVPGTQTQRGMDLGPPDLFRSILGVAGGGNHRFFSLRSACGRGEWNKNGWKNVRGGQMSSYGWGEFVGSYVSAHTHA